MSSVRPADAVAVRELLDERLEQRRQAGSQFFAAESERIARLCHKMAERFARGGRLIAAGLSPAARSDVRHIAVEFVHPVIVGKRALPALGLTGESGDIELELELTAEDRDILICFGEPSPMVAGGAIAAARARGCLTVAFSALGAEWTFEPPSADPFVRQELTETSTTCSGSSCTCSSSTADCSRAGPSGAPTTSALRASCTRSWPSASTTSTPCSPMSPPRR